MITVTQINNADEISASDWNQLLSKSETNTIFLTHQWISCWLRHLANNKKPLILIAKDNNLLGIAPFVICRKRAGLAKPRVVEFIGMGESDYCDFIADRSSKSEIITAFLNHLIKIKSDWDFISLDNIPEASSTIRIIRDYSKQSGIYLTETITSECPLLRLRENEPFARDVIRKKNVRVAYNQLSKSGNMEYHVAQNADDALAELDKLFDFHIDRRLIMGDRSKFLRNEPREFYKCLVKTMIPHGWLRFDILKLDNIPVAYHFGFLYNDSLIYYTPVFNLDYYKRSPGTVLFRLIVEDCLQKNIGNFDFARGAEWYKERFADEIRKNIRLDLYKSAYDLRLYTFTDRVKNHVKTKYPRLFESLKSNLKPSKITDIRDDISFVVGRIGLFKAIIKLIARFFHDYIFCSEDVIIFKTFPGERPKPTLSSEFIIREGRFSDLRDFIKSTPRERRGFLQNALERLKNGDRLYVVENKGKVVHYAWAQFTDRIELPEIYSHLDLEQKSGYTFHGYTLEEYRGHGIYPAVMSRIIDDLEKDGASEVYVYCLKSNKASRKSIEKAGFKPFLVMGITRIFKIIIRRSQKINP